jgi:hypothetical protein
MKKKRPSMTHTYSVLDVPRAVYAAVRALLAAAGYDHAFHNQTDGEVIDLHGIALKSRAGGAAGADVTVSTLLSSQTKEGRVELTLNSELTQMDLPKAREIVGDVAGGDRGRGVRPDALRVSHREGRVGARESGDGARRLPRDSAGLARPGASELTMSNHAEKVRLGRALVGHRVQFLSQREDATPMLVVSVAPDGLVAVEGYTGLFAPHLFRIVDSLDDLKRLLPKARWAFEMQVEAVSLEVTAIAKQISSALGEVSIDELKEAVIQEFIKRIKEPILIDGEPRQ